MAGDMDDRGPDLGEGVTVRQVAEAGGMLLGHVGDDPVLLAWLDGEIVALSAKCTHYGGPLHMGLRVDDTLRCPWHHACFSLRTGVAVEAPALAPLDLWRVEQDGGRVYVRTRLAENCAPLQNATSSPRRIVVVGAGAAGFAAIQRLRHLGYAGQLTLVGAETAAPYDRPNLSKDYLAGKAEPEWIPLESEDFYTTHQVTLRLGCAVEAVDVAARVVVTTGGEALPYDALLLATGAEPKTLQLPGFERPQVYLLRSLSDSDSLIAASKTARKVVVIGASFIALEAAAALRERGLEVTVAAPDSLPLGSKLGEAIARFVQALHEAQGVRFRLGVQIERFDGEAVHLAGGERLPADLVVVGVGVAPRLQLARAAGLRSNGGVIVDARMRTSAEGVFAAGDIAEFPDPLGDGMIRVEHWVAAERQGQVAAANMLGHDESYAEPPFFWSAHYGVSIRYVGHAPHWDRTDIDGDLSARDAEVRFTKDGEVRAVATVGRDAAALAAAQTMRERARGRRAAEAKPHLSPPTAR
jgi:apoptosis-inducing factor 3